VSQDLKPGAISKLRDLVPRQLAAIDAIKSFVAEMIEARNGEATDDAETLPSEYWRYFCLAMEYVRALPASQFKSLRLHTYHVDGETYQQVFFGERDHYAARYQRFTAGLPERYWLSAPQACGEFGHLIDGRLVNDSVLRWQELVQRLFRAGVLARLEDCRQPEILEIGAGYGALPYQLQRLLPSVRYTILDLPETLLLSGSYLTLLHGPEGVAPVRSSVELSEARAGQARFFLVPNHGLGWLRECRFDLAINIQSFQEMTAQQLDRYLSFLAPRAELLLSDNQDRQQRNRDDPRVSAALGAYFSLQELVRASQTGFPALLETVAARVLGRPRYPPVRRYLARPLPRAHESGP